MSMQTEFGQYGKLLLAYLPDEKEEEILMGDPEGLKQYLAGTPLEALLAPQNSKFLGSVVGVAMERVHRKEKDEKR
ncbi:MAG: hypothetical protein ACYCYP_12525 [Leptospirales bacterium]